MLCSRRFLAALSTLVAAGCALIPATAAADTVSLGEPPALPEGATLEGPVAPRRPLSLYVALEPRDPEGLRAYAEEVATPGSPIYGEYLSVAEFAERFGPTAREVATVRGALESQGLEVGESPADHLALPVETTAGEAEAAFDTELERLTTAEGEPGYISTSAPHIAAGVAPYVTAVIGLDDLAQPQRVDSTAAGGANPPADGTAAGIAGTVGPQPCAEASAATTETPERFGYTAEKFAAAYGFDKFYAAGNFGAGQTIALFELEPFATSDVDVFQQCYGTHAAVETIDVGTEIDHHQREYGEANLDVEQAIQLAPEAHVLSYRARQSPSAEGEILSRWVSEDRAKVMSSSYGLCEQYVEGGNAAIATTDTLLQEAAAQGQTFVVASGDYGSADCSQQEEKETALTVDYPGTDPFATDVGGTRLEEPTAARPLEYLWNDFPGWGAGGGGISAHFPMPSYQAESALGLRVVGALSSGKPCGFSGYCRQVPDVSADASTQSGYVRYFDGQWEVNGGTSAAAPLWASLVTLINASPACAGHTVGFLNPALYSIAGSDYAANFRDVVEGRPGGYQTNSRQDEDKPYPAGPGYDMATGIGTPIGDGLGASLCALVNPPAPPAPPAPEPPVPAPPAPSGTTAEPASTPAPAPAAHLMRAPRLAGIAHGAPKLRFGIAARGGAQLETVTVSLPPGLDLATSRKALSAGVLARANGRRLAVAIQTVGRSLRIRLLTPVPSASLRIGSPALTVTDGLRERVNAGGKQGVALTLTTEESGGLESRFPVQAKL